MLLDRVDRKIGGQIRASPTPVAFSICYPAPTTTKLELIGMDSELACDVTTVTRRRWIVVLVVVEVVITLASPRVGTRNDDTQSRKTDEHDKCGPTVTPETSESVEKSVPFPVVRPTESEPRHSRRHFQHHDLTGPHTIRLIQLLPGRRIDPLRCNIFHVSLDENPKSEAVSYVWGQRTTRPDSPIMTVEPGCGHIRVTDNCDKVLRLLRDYSRKRTLWVDAICINQNSDATEERNHQVALMGEIYRQASCVLIYPRGPEDDIDCAFTGLKESLQVFRGSEVLHVLRMAWFRRTWVLQEASLARKATIILEASPHRLDISFDKFILESRRGLRYMSMDTSYWPAIPDIRRELMDQAMSNKRTLRSNLLDLLISTRDLDATDPRDKIFALLGIASDGRHPEYTIDYSQTTAQVYVAYALTLLRQTSDLRLLSACNGSPLLDHYDDRNYWETKCLLPTWVPDWRRRIYRHVIWIDSYNAVYSADLRRALEQPASTTNHLRLRVRGCVVGTVHRTGPVLRGSPQVSQVAAFFGEGLATAMLPRLPYIRSSNPLEDGAPCHPFTDEAQGTKWLKNLDNLLYGCRAFKTDNGFYGLAPYQAFDGDLMCCLAGCVTPVLLRRVPKFVLDPANWYMLVGECFVHGLMNGEGLASDDLDDYEII